MAETTIKIPGAIVGHSVHRDLNKDKRDDLITASTSKKDNRVVTKVEIRLADKKGNLGNPREVLKIETEFKKKTPEFPETSNKAEEKMDLEEELEDYLDYEILTGDTKGDKKPRVCLEYLTQDGYEMKCWANDLAVTQKKTKKKTSKIDNDYGPTFAPVAPSENYKSKKTRN